MTKHAPAVRPVHNTSPSHLNPLGELTEPMVAFAWKPAPAQSGSTLVEDVLRRAGIHHQPEHVTKS
jgi:hypothetical protein